METDPLFEPFSWSHGAAPALIGLSGWQYSNWKGKFYPAGLAAKDQLGYVARTFPTLELNSTFYRLSRPSTYEKWAGQAPDGFVFAVKGWRQITQYKRLKDVAEPLAIFFRSGPVGLGKKLGPILWQLPPSLAFDEDVLSDFFALLPKTLGDAETFIRTHAPDDGVEPPIVLGEDAGQPIRYALEPRNETFRDPAVAPLLREFGVAMVMADSAGRHPEFDEVTADFTYARLHGSPKIYYSDYSAAVLEQWAERIEGWRDRGIGSYVYFDNTALGYAPKNALDLMRMVS